MLKNIFSVFYNGNAFDCYTIINKRTGEFFGTSENPFHPGGFGQYCSNVKTDRPYNGVKEFLADFRSRADEIEIKDFDSLPVNVIKFMEQRRKA